MVLHLTYVSGSAACQLTLLTPLRLVASSMLLLQENAMPRQLPDGRTESPGVLRIYLSSMIILALFYACSAVMSLILRGVAGVLRAVGVMGESRDG